MQMNDYTVAMTTYLEHEEVLGLDVNGDALEKLVILRGCHYCTVESVLCPGANNTGEKKKRKKKKA